VVLTSPHEIVLRCHCRFRGYESRKPLAWMRSYRRFQCAGCGEDFTLNDNKIRKAFDHFWRKLSDVSGAALPNTKRPAMLKSNPGVGVGRPMLDKMTVRRVLQTCCVVGLLVLAFVGLGPAKWQPRSGLGWEIDHFVGYCVITLLCCVAWPRPLFIGGALVIFAVLLEGLQAFMPDRSSYYLAAVYSASGVLVGALIADLLIRALSRFRSKTS
jgi:VanZ family protein